MPEPPRYRDRAAGGRLLADALTAWHGRADLTVLALPRGGVPVAAPVARFLDAPLGVVEVRKVGAPGQPELALGAVARTGGAQQLVCNEQVLSALGLSRATFDELAARQQAALGEGVARDAGVVPVAGRAVVLVDDGLATGSTMLAAVRAVRQQGPAEVVVAVPVASGQAVRLLRRYADVVVCPWVPRRFVAVGLAYVDFTQVEDDEVRDLLSSP